MNARVRVKICGVTNRVDAEAAIALGADALGFNLYPGSKRCITLADERSWIAALPPWVVRVAVLVNAPLEVALKVAADPVIDAVQLHGDEDSAYCSAFAASGQPFVKALRLRLGEMPAAPGQFSTSAVLIEPFTAEAYGGSGAILDLETARGTVQRNPGMHFILAGGLRPDNVGEAIRRVEPYGVDVASGVEAPGDPRRKDRARLEAFFRAVQETAAPDAVR